MAGKVYPRLHEILGANFANKIAKECLSRLSDREIVHLRMIMRENGLPRSARLESMVTLDLVADRLSHADLEIRGIGPTTREKLLGHLKAHGLSLKPE